MIDTVIYFLLTILIPLRQTYNAIRFRKRDDMHLWGVYWAIVSILSSVMQSLSLLYSIPGQFLCLLVAIWLYSDSYQGTRFLSQRVVSLVRNNPSVEALLKLLVGEQVGDKHCNQTG